jgi:hypothetical protein
MVKRNDSSYNYTIRDVNALCNDRPCRSLGAPPLWEVHPACPCWRLFQNRRNSVMPWSMMLCLDGMRVPSSHLGWVDDGEGVTTSTATTATAITTVSMLSNVQANDVGNRPRRNGIERPLWGSCPQSLQVLRPLLRPLLFTGSSACSSHLPERNSLLLFDCSARVVL